MILSVTGHRPDKLGGYRPAAAHKLFRFAIHWLQLARPDEVVTGMALGWDQAIAEACAYLGIPFVAAVPFMGQESTWPPSSREAYLRLLTRAARIEVVSPGGFSAEKMLRRNEWMVDNSDELLALHNGSPGGTAHCVRYAERKAKPTHNAWPQWELFQ